MKKTNYFNTFFDFFSTILDVNCYICREIKQKRICL